MRRTVIASMSTVQVTRKTLAVGCSSGRMDQLRRWTDLTIKILTLKMRMWICRNDLPIFVCVPSARSAKIWHLVRGVNRVLLP